MSVNLSQLRHSLLSDNAIKAHLQAGSIVIEPFDQSNLSTSSYDVTLGPFYYREKEAESGTAIYNPYSKSHVSRVWGEYQEAITHKEWSERTGQSFLENISPEDRIIWIKPGETLLAHTNEFIGGRDTVTSMMKARSSMGRNFIECCKCAGWGDVGYYNRWTMEVTNNSRQYSIPLVVGRRIAQIVFFDTDGTLSSETGNTCYNTKGKYQTNDDIEKLKIEWNPFSMIPKMYMDRECQNSLDI